MININSTSGLKGKLGLGVLIGLSLFISSCGFYLQGQGQSQRAFPPALNLYVDNALLAASVSEELAQHQVSLRMLASVAQADAALPSLQLTRTLKHTAALVLDANGDALTWRYTLSSHYSFVKAGASSETNQPTSSPLMPPISVTNDVDLSGTNATVNERIEADSWNLLYRQLARRITRQLSFE